jgi:Rrf2 family transcriptional regulator, nitric oxide-sensitive transcriptional repressor
MEAPGSDVREHHTGRLERFRPLRDSPASVYMYIRVALKQDIIYMFYRFLMRLAFSTDYALRLLMLLGLEPDRLVTIEEASARFCISKNNLMKIAYQLGQADYLETVRGRNGGLRLGKAPERIVVGEVVRTMEPDFAVVECENPTGYCKIAPSCVLRSAVREAVRAFLTKLDEYTLEDLLRPKSRLRALLGIGQQRALA